MKSIDKILDYVNVKNDNNISIVELQEGDSTEALQWLVQSSVVAVEWGEGTTQ